MSRETRRVPRAAVAVLSLSLLCIAGCLELEYKVTLREDGSGKLVMTAIATEPIVGAALFKGQERQFFEGAEGGHVQVHNVVRDKKFYRQESITFSTLAGLWLQEQRLAIEVTKPSRLSLGKTQATFTHRMVVDSNRSQEHDAFASMSTALFTDRYFTYTVELPGMVQSASALRLGDVEVEPTMQGNTVTWSVPLLLLLSKQTVLVFQAAFEGEFELAETLATPRRGFIDSVKVGDTRAVEAFLDAGIDVNGKDQTGMSALAWAASKGHTALVETLLAHSADVNAKDAAEKTVLMCAVGSNSLDIVNAMLDAGADVDATTKDGVTALMIAAERGSPTIVQALLDTGANMHTKATNGTTALAIAVRQGRTDIRQLFEQKNQELPSNIVSSDGARMVLIPAGEFLMGSDEGDDDEHPVRQMFLDAFYIDQFEVTNAQFQQFWRARGSPTQAEREGYGWVFTGISWGKVAGASWQTPWGPGRSVTGLEDRPVVQVSWHDAKAYCHWAEKRLPTEAEWEKAARGPDGRKYPWGNMFDHTQVHLCDWNCLVHLISQEPSASDGVRTVVSVATFARGASPYGVLHMAGNVREWVADWYERGYYRRSPAQNPQGPTTGDTKVLRGGAWSDVFPYLVRASNRSRLEPGFRTNYTGFRCAKTPQ